LAAFGTRGLCEALSSACLESQELVTSEYILAELRKHLTRAFRIPARQAEDVVAFVREHSDVVLPARIPSTACRDPDDLSILGTAVAGRANLLVTGDRDLLGLKRHGDIPIVTPRDCHDRLAGPTEP
jgi:putative PIN family toxin of toxin-antitoxin system